jgi:hypothetical protein
MWTRPLPWVLSIQQLEESRGQSPIETRHTGGRASLRTAGASVPAFYTRSHDNRPKCS